MASKKYPHGTLGNVRKLEVERATRTLADAVRERAAAEGRKRNAEEARLRAEEAERAVREAERAKLEQGQLTVADLMRADAWGVAASAERERLDAQVQSATDGAREAAAGEESARATVALRKADADVVEKDRAKWEDRERRTADARQEEEATEAWRPKRG